MMIFISSAIVFFAVSGCIIQILSVCGVPVSGSLAMLFERKESEYPTSEPKRREYVKIFCLALLFRIAVFLAGWLFLGIFSDGGISFRELFSENGYLKWDANNYIRIAEVGYGGYTETVDGQTLYTTLVFFPLYAWLIRIFKLILPTYGAAAMTVSFLCYSVGCCYFYGFVTAEYRRRIAKKALILISLSPFAFFFGTMMPESVFFATASACFYYIGKKKYMASGVAGLLASLSRMQGILLLIPLAVCALPVRGEDGKRHFRDVLCVLPPAILMLLGPAVYFAENYVVTGNAFMFTYYHELIWGQKAQYFGKTVRMIWQYMTGDSGQYRYSIWIPEFVLFFFTAAMSIYGLRRHKVSHTAFLLAYLIMSYTPSWVISTGRYMSVALPLYWIMAELLDRKKKLWTACIVILSILFTIYFCGFLQWRSIC